MSDEEVTYIRWDGQSVVPSDGPQCQIYTETDEQMFICGRAPGHAGMHFDDLDGIHWLAEDEAPVPDDLMDQAV